MFFISSSLNFELFILYNKSVNIVDRLQFNSCFYAQHRSRVNSRFHECINVDYFWDNSLSFNGFGRFHVIIKNLFFFKFWCLSQVQKKSIVKDCDNYKVFNELNTNVLSKYSNDFNLSFGVRQHCAIPIGVCYIH